MIDLHLIIEECCLFCFFIQYNYYIMKRFNLFLLIFCISLAVGCSSDGDFGCTTDDWIGNYTLDSTTLSCIEPDLGLSNIIVITNGNSNGTINFDGIEADLDGCTIAEQTFQLSGTLDGIELRFSGFGCTGTYIKN